MARTGLRSLRTYSPSRLIPARSLKLALLLIAVIAGAAAVHKNWFFYEDDVYISLRYAKNLLEGSGLTWNPGERVEGYTNFLFTMLVAALGWFGMDLRDAARLLSVTGYVGTLALLVAGMKRLRFYGTDPHDRTDSLVTTVPFVMTAGSFSMLLWASGALESTLFACFITAAVVMVLGGFGSIWRSHEPLAAGALFAIAALTRPEGLLFFGLTGLYQFFYRWCYESFRQSLRYCLLLALPFVVVAIPYLIWKVDYFGSVLPNTWYAKSYGVPLDVTLKNGAIYLQAFALAPPFFGLYALYFSLAGGSDPATRGPRQYLALLIFVFLFMVMREGGDHMAGFRFFVPAIPLIALQGFYCLGGMASAGRWLRIKNVGLLLTVALLLQLSALKDRHNFAPSLAGFIVADYIEEHWPPGSLISVNAAGTLPYLANEFRYIDALGLNDPVIARRVIPEITAERQRFPGHMKGDGAYVLERRPDYVILDLYWGIDYTGRAPHYLTDHELWNSPEFHAQYVKREVWIPLAERFRTPDFLARLREGLQAYYPENPPVILKDEQIRFTYYERAT